MAKIHKGNLYSPETMERVKRETAGTTHKGNLYSPESIKRFLGGMGRGIRICEGNHLYYPDITKRAMRERERRVI